VAASPRPAVAPVMRIVFVVKVRVGGSMSFGWKYGICWRCNWFGIACLDLFLCDGVGVELRETTMEK